MRKILLPILILAIFLAGCHKTTSSQESNVRESFNAVVNSLNGKQWSGFWSLLSQKSQKAFADSGYKRMKEIVNAMPPELRKKKIEHLNKTYNDFVDMSAKDFFIYIMTNTEASQTFSTVPLAPEILSIKFPTENRAEISLKNTQERAIMVREGDDWKIEFED